MNDFALSESTYTPRVDFKVSGQWMLAGKSYPENAVEFYRPVLVWVQRFIDQPAVASVCMTFDIVYFNSSSSKVFYELLDLLQCLASDISVDILWKYDPENESALEAGEDFVADFPKLSIQLIEKGAD